MKEFKFLGEIRLKVIFENQNVFEPESFWCIVGLSCHKVPAPHLMAFVMGTCVCVCVCVCVFLALILL